jgi:tRNA A-37 threonylcarbamoyl transferase component Bud32/tetratricopeptide (TPR) repeat protein
VPDEQSKLPPRYRRPERIGEGGMGEIFRAEDEVLGRTVAIKLLAERYARDASIRARFKREALAAARLSGEPNTVTIFDVGEWRERPFIVMQHLSGGSLEERLQRTGPATTGEALSWLEQAAAALDAAHRGGVVHRDVKPGNLLLDREGALHVADFGIASAPGMESLTITGTVMGTAGYLSPEQAQGERASPASDRYALAVVAFELLTGRRPFESDSPTAEAAAHVQAPIPSVSALSDLPAELDSVFERALAKDPAQRFETAADFVASLRQALAVGAGTTRRLAPTDRPVRRSPALPLVAAFLLAAAIAGAGLAAILAARGDGKSATPSVVTRTLPGTTVRRTVTEPPTSAPQPPPPSTPDGVALTDEATRLLRAGNYMGAERAARQAVAALAGSGQLYEAYAEYDLGSALVGLGRCDEALEHLDRSEEIQGERKEIDKARKECRKDDNVR